MKILIPARTDTPETKLYVEILWPVVYIIWPLFSHRIALRI